MGFTPPRCPNTDCTHHRRPELGFFRRHGSYKPRCRAVPIPRFLCKRCRKTFSLQTFRLDYRDRRPECNLPLLRALVSGSGLRQSARTLGLNVHSVQKKFRKIAHHLERLHQNLLRELPAGRTFLLDELETFEDKSIWPLSVPVLIDKESCFVVDTDVAPIRRVARAGSRRRAWLEHEERVNGKRMDRSVEVLRELFSRFERLLRGRRATLWTDMKGAYARICRQTFGEQVEHWRWSGKAPRGTWNPLFLINLTHAMLRDNVGRLHKQSWLVSKKGTFLRQQLALFVAYRNYCRKRYNRDDEHVSPASILGILQRRLELHEVLAWRQDWNELSVHPMSPDGTLTVTGKDLAADQQRGPFGSPTA